MSATPALTQIQALIKSTILLSPTVIALGATVKEGITEEGAAPFAAQFPLVEIGPVTLQVSRIAVGLHFGEAQCTIRFYMKVDQRIDTAHASLVDFADKVIQDLDLAAGFQPGLTTRNIEEPARSLIADYEADPKMVPVWVDARIGVEAMVPGDP